LGDGSIEVERFISNGEICGEEALHELFTTHADREHMEAVERVRLENVLRRNTPSPPCFHCRGGGKLGNLSSSFPLYGASVA
jgi:hypothetical protein